MDEKKRVNVASVSRFIVYNLKMGDFLFLTVFNIHYCAGGQNFFKII